MTFRDVMLAIDGVRDKDMYSQHLMRRSTFMIMAVQIGDVKARRAIKKMWPMAGDEQGPTISERNRALLKKFQDIDAKQNIKNGGRSKTGSRS